LIDSILVSRYPDNATLEITLTIKRPKTE